MVITSTMIVVCIQIIKLILTKIMLKAV